MSLNSKTVWFVGAGMLTLALVLSLILYLIPNGSVPQNSAGQITFGEAPSIISGDGAGATSTQNDLPVFAEGTNVADLSAVFKISDGPVISGVLMDIKNPTTTIARFITAEDGHVLDLPLDVPGASPHAISNTTIPGIERAVWLPNGRGVVVQYFNTGILKSALLLLPPATTTVATASSTKPTSIRFLPDNAIDIASSPDGTQLAYMLSSSSGTDGYIQKINGTSPKKLFSLPLSQVLLAWPSPSKLLLYQKSAVGAPGIAFSVDAASGKTQPVLYGSGLTVSANADFGSLFYQVNTGAGAASYLQTSTALSLIGLPPFAPAAPEQCIWGINVKTTLFCAAHAGVTDANYLDLWHQGAASVADALLSIDTKTGTVVPIAVPGQNSGEYSDIINLSLSQSDSYLSFVSKDDEKLWGVRLHN